ncbi:MAG: hypothetical protein EBZ47_09995, partial [Chlamydiae bacterium]|nr:hypothetical protein [Chlamydiota bacterium]
AAGIAALGAYAVYKTDAGKPVKKAINTFVHNAKKEVKAELKKAKTVSKSVYEKAVKDVVSRYKQGKLGMNQLKDIAMELKGSWKEIEAEFKNDIKVVKKIVKRAGAKSAKKK